LSAHSKVCRHLECTAQLAASTLQCSAAQLFLGGKPGQCTRMHSINPAKCTASSVFAKGSVHFISHITPSRQLEEKRHLAKLLVQLSSTHNGLGCKVESSKGQLLMQAKVSSTVAPNRAGDCRNIEVLTTASCGMGKSVAVNAAVYLSGTHLSAHSKVCRHLECTAQLAASTLQCSAAQLFLGGKPGQCTRMHSINPAKCTASSVFAKGSVHFISHITPSRQLEEKRHLAKLLVQLSSTHNGLGCKVESSKGQLLMQAKVSSTVAPNRAGDCRNIDISTSAFLTMQASLSVPAKREGVNLTSETLKLCFTGTQPSSFPQ